MFKIKNTDESNQNIWDGNVVIQFLFLFVKKIIIKYINCNWFYKMFDLHRNKIEKRSNLWTFRHIHFT